MVMGNAGAADRFKLQKLNPKFQKFKSFRFDKSFLPFREEFPLWGLGGIGGKRIDPNGELLIELLGIRTIGKVEKKL